MSNVSVVSTIIVQPPAPARLPKKFPESSAAIPEFAISAGVINNTASPISPESFVAPKGTSISFLNPVFGFSSLALSKANFNSFSGLCIITASASEGNLTLSLDDPLFDQWSQNLNIPMDSKVTAVVALVAEADGKLSIRIISHSAQSLSFLT